ncbi:ATP-dependent helicase [Cohnella faecalis]|uniref:DNA 3'-5' helicase n=1 Tax=Cohnella faecalis TaxID=2315694 RepID=A0A398CLQ5_9BACL|nr:ATP-dependent helicase [Cohnella faecalis]RIE03583.1 ATP-dependent helicase [Cohnella faecalis]
MHTHRHFFTRKQTEIGVALNEVQQQAVLHSEGALLLLASPGSGKTTTIIMRIGFLIEEKGVPSSRIKAVTFSRASAKDMKERFDRFFPDHAAAARSVDFSTIHSLAFAVARDHFYKTGITYQLIEGEMDLEELELSGPDQLVLHKKFILRQLFKSLTGESITDDQMEELTRYISYIKNKLVPENQWAKVKCDVKEADKLLREYERFKREGTGKLLVDYDDMLTIANDALETDRALLARYQRRYDYVMTDESQDTSLVQHAIIEKLVREHGNLCVVADDDQSIYTWRAAEPQYLLDFRKTYPRAAILKMEQNYRSSPDIVSVANRFIKQNKNRYDKNMFTKNKTHKPIKIKSLPDYRVQAKHLAERIAKLDDWRETAILYRNNSSSIALMNEFDRQGIPFYMKDGDNRFFSHWVVEDVLNFMRMSFTDKRPDILERIHTKCAGYITKQQMAAVKGFANNESVFDNLINYVHLQEYQIKLLQGCKETFEHMSGMAPKKAIVVIRYKLGYEKALEKMCDKFGFRKEVLLGILNTLEDIAESLETMEEFAKRLKHLETVMKTSKFNKNANAVTFSTLHSSKGLEFERVYMIDLVEGIIPSDEDAKKVQGEYTDAMEEAVRLFYVGMTRAKRHLELLSYKMRDGAEAKESRFLAGVRNIQSPPKEAEAAAGKSGVSVNVGTVKERSKPRNPNAIRDKALLVPGRSVAHRVFGAVKIVKVEGDRLQIKVSSEMKELSVAACLERGLLEKIMTKDY